MRLPTANALAPTSEHIEAEALSVCTRIALKSTPKRLSMKERTSEGKGLPHVAFWMRFSSSGLTVLSSCLLYWAVRWTAVSEPLRMLY
jgi:hypothetical protein